MMKTVSVDNDNQIAILRAMLNHIKSDDSQFRSFIKQQISKRHHESRQNNANKEIIRRLKIQNKKLLQQVSSLREQLKQMKGDNNEMLKRLNQYMKLCNSLSGALGSCSACWGEDPDCIHCAGNGSSGWRNINRRLFNIYVLPVMHTLEKMYGSGKKMS